MFECFLCRLLIQCSTTILIKTIFLYANISNDKLEKLTFSKQGIDRAACHFSTRWRPNSKAGTTIIRWCAPVAQDETSTFHGSSGCWAWVVRLGFQSYLWALVFRNLKRKVERNRRNSLEKLNHILLSFSYLFFHIWYFW